MARWIGGIAGGVALAAVPATAAAADGSAINPGDTAWLLMATALVMVMLPGLALFYGGLVRRKNVLSTIMHSFFGLALVSVVWVAWGYRLAFAPGGIPGHHRRARLRRLRECRHRRRTRDYAPAIPAVLFASFQLMFAAITPALITGAFAERKRFAAFVIFTLLWSTLVYSPLAHWVWAPDGWLRHWAPSISPAARSSTSSSGVSALVVAVLVGPRLINGERRRAARPADDRARGRLLWFGWFGFNAGSALAGERPGGQRAAGHEHRRRGGLPDLDGRELAAPGKVTRGRRRGGRRGGPRGDHARVRLS